MTDLFVLRSVYGARANSVQTRANYARNEKCTQVNTRAYGIYILAVAAAIREERRL